MSFLHNEDRRVLEQIILPYFLRDPCYRSVLFVGCDWYTQGYNTLFEQEKKYITIDSDAAKRRYGGKHHIVDGLQNLGRYFKSGDLDLILCNGVVGWGLDAREDIEHAFEACFNSLRDGGILMVGWNDVEEHRPVALDECKSLQLFYRFEFPPLDAAVYVTGTPYRHTYNFYRRLSVP
jgi:hypothetical protein